MGVVVGIEAVGGVVKDGTVGDTVEEAVVGLGDLFLVLETSLLLELVRNLSSKISVSVCLFLPMR